MDSGQESTSPQGAEEPGRGGLAPTLGLQGDPRSSPHTLPSPGTFGVPA